MMPPGPCLPGLYQAAVAGAELIFGETEVLPPTGEVAKVARWDDGRKFVCGRLAAQSELPL